jgi:hypothetical protein
MSKQSKFATLAVIAGLPALLMVANLTMFAFVGYGFLPEGNGDMNAARGVITWLSASVSVFLTIGAVT